MSNEALQNELKAEAESHKGALVSVLSFEVETQEQVDFAKESIKEAAAKWKELEEKRTSVTKPMNEALRQVNSWFKPPQATLKEIQKALKAKVYAAQQRAEAERQRLIEEARQAEDVIEVRDNLVAAAEAKIESKGLVFRSHWTFEIEDESKIPREYLVPDTVAIGAVVRGTKGKTKIPGVRIFEKKV